jgi:hypothetical protein
MPPLNAAGSAQNAGFGETLVNCRLDGRLMKYSRIIVVFSVGLICVAINFWLVTNGHYKAPLFVFLGCIFITWIVLRRLPPVTTNPQEVRSNQLKAVSSLRRLGFIYVLGFVFGLISLFSGEFKDLPIWGRVLLFCWSGFLIWGCFSLAGRLKKRATEK